MTGLPIGGLSVLCTGLLLAISINQESKGPSEADVKKAELALAINADDPEANLTMGKYLAFIKGDWDKAIPYLSKGSDAALKSAALKDLAGTKTPSEKVTLGDEWLAGAKKHQALRRSLEDRAASLYAKAWPDLDGKLKMNLRERALKMSAPLTPGAARKGLPPRWLPDWHPKEWPQRPSLDSSFAHEGSCSVKLPSVPDAKTPNSFISLASDLIPASGKTGEITAWIRSEGTESGQDHLEIHFHDQTGRHFHTERAGLVPVDCYVACPMARISGLRCA